MPNTTSSDCVVIGGGVIGLSIAYRLASQGLAVTLLERGLPGREASWAGAGILPPASWYLDHPALDALAAFSHRLHADWSAELLELTGVDNQHRCCGSVIQETDENQAAVRATLERWRGLGVRVESTEDSGASWFVPDEAQVRNPRHLRALEEGVRRRGGRVIAGAPVEGFCRQGDRIESVATPEGKHHAEWFCLASGCWAPRLATRAGFKLPGEPVRGQMLLLEPTRGEEPLERIIHRYPYYAVPRRDGRVLVGATVERVGFDKQTTPAAHRELHAAAVAMAPGLAKYRELGFWSGLRPAGAGRLPEIGPAPGLTNLLVSAGHHRSGLLCSTGAALMIDALVRGVDPPLPLGPFRLDRLALAAI